MKKVQGWLLIVIGLAGCLLLLAAGLRGTFKPAPQSVSVYAPQNGEFLPAQQVNFSELNQARSMKVSTIEVSMQEFQSRVMASKVRPLVVFAKGDGSSRPVWEYWLARGDGMFYRHLLKPSVPDGRLLYGEVWTRQSAAEYTVAYELQWEVMGSLIVLFLIVVAWGTSDIVNIQGVRPGSQTQPQYSEE